MAGPEFAIQLMGRFSLLRGPQRVALPRASRRLIAFLALHPHQQRRSYIAGQLWPEVSEARSRANLRNAVWRTQPLGEGLLRCSGDTVGLAPEVVIDVSHVREQANTLLGPATRNQSLPHPEMFGEELLVGWSDDWALFERERCKQLCLHALEALSARYLTARAYAAAIDSALLAVRLEPLRESAHRAVSRAHLAEGNLSEARRQYVWYSGLVSTELGIEPSKEYTELVRVEAMRRQQPA